MELTTEQKARVFALYIGSRIEYATQHGPSEIQSVGILSIGQQWDDTIFCVRGQINGDILGGVDLESDRLLLRPLSAITEEDAMDFIKVRNSINWKGPQDKEAVTRYVLAAIGPPIEQGFGFHWEVYQFLIQRGYAVPLFITPGHPDNGKTAIELGLAIAQD